MWCVLRALLVSLGYVFAETCEAELAEFRGPARDSNQRCTECPKRYAASGEDVRKHYRVENWKETVSRGGGVWGRLVGVCSCDDRKIWSSLHG